MAGSVNVAVAYEDSYCMLVTWGASFAFPVIGSKPFPGESARQQARALTTYGKRIGPGKLAQMSIIAPDAPILGPEARAAYDAAAPIIAPVYGCVTAVFEEAGFRGAMVRALVASFALLSRAKYPQKVFPSIGEAASWAFPYTQRMGLGISSADEIVAAARTVREMAVARGIFSSLDAASGARAP